MEVRQRNNINPDLEQLRLKALQSVELDHENIEIDRLIERTSRIHAGFLFYSPKTLQPLLRAVGETNSSAVEFGWQSFGDKLGLDVTILKVINNNQFNNEDPMYNTLLHYVQFEDATVGRILTALREIGRLDVIARCKSSITQLADVIFNHEQELLRTSNVNGIEPEHHSDYEDMPLNEVLIRPTIIPDAPFIMKNLQPAPLLSTLLLQGVASARTNVICAASFTRAIEASPLSMASPSRSSVTDATDNCEVTDIVRTAPRQYGKKVLLTFAADGADIASEVAQIFRRRRDDLPYLGVLILEEQRRHLQADPLHFINAAFLQVNYVIPILTEGYLKSVLKKVSSKIGTEESIDAQFVPFIYKLMMSHYAQNGCMNDKVRCLVPDGTIQQLKTQVMMAGPLFVVWESTSQAEAMAVRLLQSEA